MKKLFILVIMLLANLLQAQYTQTDAELINAEFNRDFDNPVIREYLNSGNVMKVNAALLCLAHSRDTSYVDEIIQLDFDSHADFITFSLGQLGTSSKSTKYLFDRLDSSVTNRSLILPALGLTGDIYTADYLIHVYGMEPGIPTALVNFYMRGIADSSYLEFLHNALINELPPSLQFEVLYAMYRIGPDSRDSDVLTEIAIDSSSLEPTENRLYALGCLRKLKSFNKPDLVLSFVADPDWRIRNEAAKTIVYSNYSSEKLLNSYFQFFRDENPNVARTVAREIRNIKVSGGDKSRLTDLLISAMSEDRLTVNAMGEAFISLCKLKPDIIPDLIDEYEQSVTPEFRNTAISFYSSNPDWVFNYIKNQLPGAKEKDLLSLAPPLLGLQSNFIQNEEFGKTILTLLKSDYPSTISVVADGLDSLFIKNHSQILQQIVFELSFKYMNDTKFTESILSLASLSEKISEPFHASVLDLLVSSKIPAVRSLTEQEQTGGESGNSQILYEIVKNSFVYRTAKVNTSEGSFTIKFLPGYAPVSVGNFCRLTAQKYFDDVVFHRVVPNFVIQTGDPSGTGWGGPGYEIVSELSPLKFTRGMVGMARAGFDTEGSQWFVMHSSYPHLNGRYTVFGEVTEGMDVVDNIDQNDKIISVELK